MQYSSAISRLALLTIQLAIALESARADQAVNLLPNGGGEIPGDSTDVPSSWFAASVPAVGLTMERTVDGPHSGSACLFIANTADYKQPVSNNWAQQLRYIPKGRTVQLRCYIRTENAEAANVCVQCWGPSGESLIGFASTPVLKGTRDWTESHSDRLTVPPETTILMVRAALTGKGRAFFDDVSLDIVGPEVVNDPGLAASVSGRILSRLPLLRDSMILSYLPTWNHGNVDNVAVANNDGGVRTLIAWPKPAPAPKNAKRKYVVAMYSRETRVKDNPGPLQMYPILEEWKEMVSWKEAPRVASEPMLTFDMVPGNGWKFFDVTPLVEQNASSDHAANGVSLRFSKEDRKADDKNWSGYAFVSREGIGEWESRRPVLLVIDPDQPPLPDPVTPASKSPSEPSLTSAEFLDFIDYLASLPNVSIESALGAATAQGDASQAASAALTKSYSPNLDPWAADKKLHASQIPPYEKFVAAYPLTSEGVMTMGSILVSEYARSGRPADAERLATAASRLAAGTELEYIVEINRSYVEWHNGKHEVGEHRLRQIVAKPLPKIEDRRTLDILFVAPQQLADFLRESGKRDESDRLYQELADHGFDWDKKHPDSQGVGESYVIAAYRGRIQLIVDHDPKDTAAERLIAELKKRLPYAAEQLTRELTTMRGQAPPMAGRMIRDSEISEIEHGKKEGAQQ
jgi:hypothetical protein